MKALFSDPNTKTDLDFPFTCKEIKTQTSKLKMNKKEGIDMITNEMLKFGKTALALPLVKLFNFILDKGDFPEVWNISLISTTYKKGDPNDCNNYRGISLSNCMSKLFTSLLHNRLIKYLEDKNYFNPYQAGFRPEHRTTDHIFAIKTIINKYVYNLKKPVYCCFVDFSKAFDSVSRNSLFYKFLKTGVGGKFFNLIKALYSNTKFRFKVGTSLGPERLSCRGVKQGDGLSPLLFNIFVNDICEIFDIECDPVSIEDLEINCLLYADDLLLISQSEEGLQNCLNALQEYCILWKLEVNLDKTKVMIFNRKKTKLKQEIYYNNKPVEQVDSYQYLGINFTHTGNLKQAAINLSQKASKALFSLNSKIKEYTKLNTQTLMKLFDTLIVPILTYASEIWFADFKIDLFNDNNPFEAIHLKACKFSLGIHNKSSNIASKCELGRYPIVITILKLLQNYYKRLVQLPSNRFLAKLFKTDRELCSKGSKSWTGCVKKDRDLYRDSKH